MNSNASQPHPQAISHVMLTVIAALIPGCIAHLYLTGWGGLLNLTIAASAAVACEYLVCRVRDLPVRETLGDYSALLTGLLIGLCLPPLVSIWIPVMASAFAILLAKHVYGGIGNNIFNPAMVGYAIVLVSFPRDLSLWPTLPEAFSITLSQTIEIIGTGGLPAHLNWDSYTGATTLDALKTTTDATLGPERWANAAFLLGGLLLMKARIVSWHIPVSLLLTLTLCATLDRSIDPNAAGITTHLFAGATMLGAFFIATDPVSAATGRIGRLLFGAGIGLLIWLIRKYGGFPDAIAFAVLLMNCTAPALDYLEPWRRAE